MTFRGRWMGLGSMKTTCRKTAPFLRLLGIRQNSVNTRCLPVSRFIIQVASWIWLILQIAASRGMQTVTSSLGLPLLVRWTRTRPTLCNMLINAGSMPKVGTLAFALFYVMLFIPILDLLVLLLFQFLFCFKESQYNLMSNNYSGLSKPCFVLILFMACMIEWSSTNP